MQTRHTPSELLCADNIMRYEEYSLCDSDPHNVFVTMQTCMNIADHFNDSVFILFFLFVYLS